MRTLVFGVIAIAMVIEATPAQAAPQRPEAYDTLSGILNQTAAIIEGDTTDISYTYDEQQGPRTIVTVSKVSARWGTFPDSEVRLSILGGPLPNNKFLEVSELPHFYVGGHYIVFLSNRSWFHSPVIGNLALRVEKVNEASVLIGDAGNIVLGLSDSGVVQTPFQVFPARNDSATRVARPTLLRDVPSQMIAHAPTLDDFVTAVKSRADGIHITPSGNFIPTPESRSTWRMTSATAGPGTSPSPDSSTPSASPIFWPAVILQPKEFFMRHLTIHRTMVAATCLLSLGLYAASARAYNYSTCNGITITPDHTPYGTVLNTYSIPFGSWPADAYFHSISEFSTVSANTVYHYGYWDSSHTSVVHGDGWWDVSLVNRSDINGATGLTYKILDGCPFFYSTEHINEADVMMANDQTYFNPDEAFLAFSDGRTAMLHEFGHAHGLEHNNSFDLMRVSQPLPLVGGTGDHAELTGDETGYIRAIWSPFPGEVNLYASADLNANGNIGGTFTPTTTVRLCPGNTWPVQFTVGNNGATNLTFNQRMLVNTSPPTSGYSGGIVWGNWFGATVNANSAFTWGAGQWTIPTTWPREQTLWIYHQVDFDNHVNEVWNNGVSREFDNIVHPSMTIIVGSVASCGR